MNKTAEHTILLAGNPNVGKSTLFNALTGMKQHTGNWTGKTVQTAEGFFRLGKRKFRLIDLPGAYSLDADSPDEQAAGDAIRSGAYDGIIIMADASCLARNLILTLQILEITNKAVLCVNLADEAEKRGISVDEKRLSEMLGIPVVRTAARSRQGINRLMKETEKMLCRKESHIPPENLTNDNTLRIKRCHEITSRCVRCKSCPYTKRERRLDRILTSKITGIPIMLLIFGLIFFITISGANYPSELLSNMFAALGDWLSSLLENAGADERICSLLMDGIYGTLTAVISVMLPPMAIFFPLFTLMEDFGLLPRIAFNLDPVFRRAGSSGKQSLTMMMGFGCNACGVTGCRIMENRCDRCIAAATNNFAPCNGRFPTLIAIISIFLVSSVPSQFRSAAGALILTGLIVFSIFMSVLSTKLLALLTHKKTSGFLLELPPYRRPEIISTLVRSLFDRTIVILGRAVAVAAPAGLLLWLMANISIGDKTPVMYLRDFLEPAGRIMGLDGAILTGFLLGFPANEIVLPITLMVYLSDGTMTQSDNLAQLSEILVQNGWTIKTAVCMLLFTLMHFPCSTTCLTIKKETGSVKWTIISILLPTVCGIICCIAANAILSLFC